MFAVNNNCYSQQTKMVYGEYTYHTTESMSIEEAKKIALDRAKIQSVADAFGTDVSQSASTTVSNYNGKSDTHFSMNGLTDVKGEWIETVGDPIFDIKVESPWIIINCKVKGKVREIIRPEIDIEVKVLKNGLSKSFESNEFIDGDDLYVFFKSSLSGYVTIYLIQNNIAYRLLPYKENDFGEYPVVGGKDYLFFSKSTDISNDKTIDEYELFADKEIDVADILILYSPNAIGNSEIADNAYDEPLSIDIELFNEWIVRKRNKDKYSRVFLIPLTIRKS